MITSSFQNSTIMAFNRHTNSVSILIVLFCFSLDCGSSAKDTITSYQSIKDPQTLSSNNSKFTLGFFSPENSTNRYVGIWYMTKSTVVWVANRNQPLRDISGSFTISEDGNLVVLNGAKQVIWSSNVSNIITNSSSQLTDSGNLVLVDNTGNRVWESFQHPTDTWLPNMKLTNNLRTGQKVQITSWKSPSDPSTGNFSAALGNHSMPEGFIWNETRPFWRSGPWNGQVFIGIPLMNSSYLNGFDAGEEDGSSYATFSYANESFLAVIVLNWQGTYERKYWADEKEWQVDWKALTTACDVYGTCGAFGICSSASSPICSCFEGFEPRNREEWNRQNWTSGCVRRTSLQCGSSEEDGFLKLQKVKVPDLSEWSFVKTEDTCRSQCLNNCSCNAYAYDPGIGCMSWSGNLIDTQQFSTGSIDLYIRLAKSDLGVNDKKNHATIIITPTVIVGMIFILNCAYFFRKHLDRERKKDGLSVFHSGKAPATTNKSDIRELSNVELQELLLFDAEKLAIATNNFDASNKLGQGGFGPVYKGKLQDGQEIAVKRLSTTSGQGLEEFVNEVAVISKLQHRNLVKLLGCCREGDEKMLIYEYLPNKSLDTFIFGPPDHKVLDWGRRFTIIEGIARGLLYLHRDSRLKIIHRDLKASNILLDEELNPKISDFGLARIFGGRGNEANTRRVVGTYGYMAPEYAMGGLFSEKSDIFSFGVLLLEIVSGKRNTSFYNDEQSLNLLEFAWKLWNEDNIVSLIDPSICNAVCEKEILRCVHIGLLCTQENARGRPTMATVISMLSSEIVNLVPPGKPAFILRQNLINSSSSYDCHAVPSNISVSITDIQGR